jgi:pSer/pThr/pTyr-binding forkhead associated (FHA) protein
MWFKKRQNGFESLRLVAEDANGITAVKLAQCRHCGREIYRPTVVTWAHLDNNIVLCDPLVDEHLRAEPIVRQQPA